MTSPSPTNFVNQEQQNTKSPSVVESSTAPAVSTDQDRNAGSSSPVADELREQIAGLKDDIRKLKLNQDPKREAVKHTLLQGEVAQLREENLDLRVELQVAQDKHHALQSEHQRCENQVGNLMKQAIENLSMGVNLFKEGSTATEASAPGVVLSPRKPVSNPPVEKTIKTSSPFQTGATTPHWVFPTGSTSQGSIAQTYTFGQPPFRSADAKALSLPPGASQTTQPNAPKSPFSAFASGSTPSSSFPLASTLPPATSTVTGFLDSPVSKAASSIFGNHKQPAGREADGTKSNPFNFPA